MLETPIVAFGAVCPCSRNDPSFHRGAGLSQAREFEVRVGHFYRNWFEIEVDVDLSIDDLPTEFLMRGALFQVIG